jgi:hypothetical protein
VLQTAVFSSIRLRTRTALILFHESNSVITYRNFPPLKPAHTLGAIGGKTSIFVER